MNTSSEELKKVIQSLEKALKEKKNDIVRDATIQRFEFCIELAWKTAKKFMGTNTSAPKQVIREMAQNHYISDVTLWLEAIDHRNLSSHTYKEEIAEKVYSFAKNFLNELESLLAKLK